MKTLKDTVEGMLSENFENRLIAEIEQLDIRIYKLEKRINTLSKDDPEYGFLNTQYVHMTDYLNDLLSRAKARNLSINLPSVETRLKDICDESDINLDKDDFNEPFPKDPMFWLIVLFMLAANNNKE